MPAVFDEQTLRFYAEEAPVYAASGPGGVNRHLHDFLEMLKPGAHILELGCGGGLDSELMLSRGFDVEPTDGVPEIARQAEERLGRPVAVMRFDELVACGAYDAVWASASLLHVPRTGLPAILARILRALKPGGLHFGSYKGGGSEGRDRFERYFNYFSREQLIEAYRQAGPWEIVATREYLGGGYDGKMGPWINIIAAAPEGR